MSAREEVLARVRSALAGVTPPAAAGPPAYRTRGDLGREAVLGLFAERVADYRAEVTRCTPAGLPDAVAAALARHGARRVAVPAGVPAAWRGAGVEWVVDEGQLTHDELDRVDGVLSGCAAGIAVTGTFVLDGGATSGRRVLTLLPDLHVCVVLAADVVESVPQALARLDGRRALTFVSGPSATSDIELDRVEGVHGPRTLEVLLVEG